MLRIIKYGECRVLFVITKSAVVLNVVMLSVIVLSVAAPSANSIDNSTQI
jgi:hypothetical protein